MEESVSGFSDRGPWGDVVELGERITMALVDCEVSGAAFDDWDEWRPKSHERFDDDLNEKTAEQAAIEKGEGERRGKRPDEDLKTAGKKLTESYEKLEEDTDEAVERWGESLDYVARAADSAGRKALRAVEGAVYRNVMTKLAPYYFDNELVSANLQRLRGTEEYRLEVNINDDDLKIKVSNKLADYEHDVARWHVDTPKDTTALETVEGGDGVEVPKTEEDSDPTTT